MRASEQASQRAIECEKTFSKNIVLFTFICVFRPCLTNPMKWTRLITTTEYRTRNEYIWKCFWVHTIFLLLLLFLWWATHSYSGFFFSNYIFWSWLSEYIRIGFEYAWWNHTIQIDGYILWYFEWYTLFVSNRHEKVFFFLFLKSPGTTHLNSIQLLFVNVFFLLVNQGALDFKRHISCLRENK